VVCDIYTANGSLAAAEGVFNNRTICACFVLFTAQCLEAFPVCLGEGRMLTYYVVQSYQAGKKGNLFADEPVAVSDLRHAQRLAERLSSSKVGVLAFSRTGDPATGEYQDAVVIVAFGQVPVELAGRSAA
jgi:hypothetical protein